MRSIGAEWCATLRRKHAEPALRFKENCGICKRGGRGRSCCIRNYVAACGDFPSGNDENEAKSGVPIGGDPV